MLTYTAAEPRAVSVWTAIVPRGGCTGVKGGCHTSGPQWGPCRGSPRALGSQQGQRPPDFKSTHLSFSGPPCTVFPGGLEVAGPETYLLSERIQSRLLGVSL